MKKIFKSKLILQVVMASLIATLATAGIVGAATTIGANISTTGTLGVTGTNTLFGATNIGGAITATSTMAVSKGITIAPAYGLDATTAGVLNIGTSTANAVRIGSTWVTTTIGGPLTVTGTTTLSNNITVPAAYGFDTASAGQLNIGTSTANAVRIGSTWVTTTIGGPLTVTGTTTLSNNITVPAGYGLDIASGGGVLNIGTSTATTINIGRTGQTVTMPGNLTVTGTFSPAITAINGNLTVPPAYSLDTASAGQLNIGTSTANAVRIGSTWVTTTIGGPLTVTGTTTLSNNITVPAGYGLDIASGGGVLNIGTTTASSITIGKSAILTNFPGYVTMTNASTTNASSTLASFGGGTTVSGLLWGTCAVNPQSITVGTSSVVSTSCNTTITGLTSTAGYKVFVTPPSDGIISSDNWLVFKGATASTTDGYIEITLFNASTTADIDGPSKTWSWMAIK